jgi:hypothetical protein
MSSGRTGISSIAKRAPGRIDRQAIEWAKHLVAGRAIELWCGERFVAKFEPKPK